MGDAVQILSKLKPCDRVVNVLKDGEGWYEGHFYFAMDLQGRNVAELQRGCPGSRFDLATCKSFGDLLPCCSASQHHPGRYPRATAPF